MKRIDVTDVHEKIRGFLKAREELIHSYLAHFPEYLFSKESGKTWKVISIQPPTTFYNHIYVTLEEVNECKLGVFKSIFGESKQPKQVIKLLSALCDQIKNGIIVPINEPEIKNENENKSGL